MKSVYSNEESKSKSEKRQRWRKIILIALLGIYALMGWLRLRGALIYRDYFITLNVWPRPIYLALTGGMIGLAFTLAVIFLIFKWRFAALYTRWLAVAFLLWFWIDRIWLSIREAFFNQLETGILITLATLFWAFILINKKDLHQESEEMEENGQQTGTGSQVLPE